MVTYATPMHTPHVGSIILYTCEDGFALVGDSMAECLLDGNWSVLIPTCFQGLVSPRKFSHIIIRILSHYIGLDRNDLFPFGTSAGDQLLPRGDDEFLEVDLSVIFPFFDEGERRLFVSGPVKGTPHDKYTYLIKVLLREHCSLQYQCNKLL